MPETVSTQALDEIKARLEHHLAVMEELVRLASANLERTRAILAAMQAERVAWSVRR